MTEILTESFCERCGTRYTFESARPKMRLKGFKVMSRGLKNFVLSDETSMDEAMAAARSETDRETTAYQLDAFHKTFNFCMQCRQYTCPNCWNEAEVRCLTCAPHLGHEVMPAPFPDLPAPSAYLADPVADVATGTNGNGWHDTNGATQDDDGDGFDFTARLAALTAPVASTAAPVADPESDAPVEAVVDGPIPEPVVALEPPVVAPAPTPMAKILAAAVVTETVVVEEPPVLAPAPEPVLQPLAVTPVPESVVVEASPVVAAEPEPVVEADEADRQAAALLAALGAAAVVADTVTPEADPGRTIGDKITGQTTGLLKRFRPVESIDAELDADEQRTYGAEMAAAAAAAAAGTAAEPTIAAQGTPAPEVVPVVAAEPAPIVAPEPSAAVQPETVAAAATPPVAEDVVSQPTWRMVAPDPAVDAAPEPPASQPAAANGAKPGSEPQWPERPQWLGGGPSNGLPFLNRPATPQGGVEALWAQSNAEVVSPAGPAKAASAVQPCVSCGLSLSATAKFCRRCGTPQAG